MQTIEVLGWVLFAIWAVVSGIPTVWLLGRSLNRQSDRLADPASWPRVSVIVPARDEGPKIEAGLKSLLASDYPNIEIVAIDDRSRDDTGAIMDRLANESDGKLRVIHITDLPEGWLGKNHALQVVLNSPTANGCCLRMVMWFTLRRHYGRRFGSWWLAARIIWRCSRILSREECSRRRS